MWGQRLCAAKLLHPIFFQSNDPGIATTRRRFEQECRFLNDMKHPNIVEYLGTSHDPDSGLLVLLMELADESLTHFLEQSQQPLAYHIEVDLCHDTAQALAYIHSREIIHRDLSGNNVLLIAGKAKITDFGMSRLLDENRRKTSLTMCPGTLVYMSPEALRDPPAYTKKIDCFSFGVLQIQIMTRQFPDPGPAKQVVEDSRSPTGTMEMPILDRERRKSHIDLINPTHALLPTALSCLSYLEKDRPTAQDLCQQLATIKETPRYMQLAQLREQNEEQAQQIRQLHQQLQTLQQELQDSQRRTHSLQQELQDSQRRMDTLQQQLQTKDQALQDSRRNTHTLQQELQDSQRRTRTLQQELQDSQRRTHTLQQELQDRQRQNQQLTHQVEEKQHTIDEVDRQLQANEQVTAEFQRNLLQHEQTNSQLRRDLQQAVEEKQAGERQLQELTQRLQVMQVGVQEKSITRPSQELQAQPVEHAAVGQQRQLQKPKTQQLQQMKRTETPPQKALVQQKTIRDMKWQKESKAPEAMWRGSAASDSKMAYFNGCGSTKVYSYDSDTQKWRQLPDTPHTRSALVVVQHILTMVGGYVSGKATNSLLSLMGVGGAMKWLPHYPAMPTARQDTAAVCSGHSLIVAGGRGDRYNTLATVEMLDIDTKQWSTACSLPHPFTRATISICRERLYLMGGDGLTHSVLTCSVPELLQSQTEKLRTEPEPDRQTTKWRRIADAPSSFSCATLCGQLVAVGGWKDDKDTAAIFVYKETTDSWEAMGDMPTARSEALVAILNGKLMAVGGLVWKWGLGTVTDVVEILC